MNRYIETDGRPVPLLSECLNHYSGEDNSARGAESFVDEIDLGTLGFGGVDRTFSRGKIPARMGQIDASIHRYLAALPTTDRTGPAAGGSD
jgi:hypothetical protein